MTEHRIKRGAQWLSVCIALIIGWMIMPMDRFRDTPRDADIPPLLHTEAPLRKWKYITIHHSAGPSGSAASFDKYHRNQRRMENGLAYHFVIGNGSKTGDGEIEVGHRWVKQLQGGHVKEDAINDIAIGICLVGDFTKTDPSEKQLDAIVYLVRLLIRTYNLSTTFVVPHHELGQSVCPGPLFPWQEFMFRVEQDIDGPSLEDYFHEVDL